MDQVDILFGLLAFLVGFGVMFLFTFWTLLISIEILPAIICICCMMGILGILFLFID